MTSGGPVDLNLLAARDALPQETNVAKAADRLGTSPAAVRRDLAGLHGIVLTRGSSVHLGRPQTLPAKPTAR